MVSPSLTFGPLPGGRSKYGDLAIRTAGSLWFFLLAALVVFAVINDLAIGDRPVVWTEVVSHAGLLLFYLTLWLMVLIRPAPIRTSQGILPNATAFVGTYMPWLIVLFPHPVLSAPVQIIATGVILCGNLLTLLTVWRLGRSFSLVPQARKLVTKGPYGRIRHPLYLAEEIMVCGTALLYLSPATIALVLGHLCIQVRRMYYEEDLLGRAFPDYAAYKARTWRVLPWVW